MDTEPPKEKQLPRGVVMSAAAKIAIGIVGTVVVLAGVVMLVAPGQGILTILLGLGILATEFEWARVWLLKAREHFRDAVRRVRGKDEDEGGG